MYRPITISKQLQENFELGVVINKIRKCYLPYELANNNPTKLAAFYVGSRLGNRPQEVQKIDQPCEHVSDGPAKFN